MLIMTVIGYSSTAMAAVFAILLRALRSTRIDTVPNATGSSLRSRRTSTRSRGSGRA